VAHYERRRIIAASETLAASIISEHFQVGAKISEGVILSEAKAESARREANLL
jgi:hypothetical protein